MNRQKKFLQRDRLSLYFILSLLFLSLSIAYLLFGTAEGWLVDKQKAGVILGTVSLGCSTIAFGVEIQKVRSRSK